MNSCRACCSASNSTRQPHGNLSGSLHRAQSGSRCGGERQACGLSCAPDRMPLSTCQRRWPPGHARHILQHAFERWWEFQYTSRHISLRPYLFPSQTGRLWARFPCRRESRTLQPGNATSAVSNGCVAVEAAATARRRTGVCQVAREVPACRVEWLKSVQELSKPQTQCAGAVKAANGAGLYAPEPPSPCELDRFAMVSCVRLFRVPPRSIEIRNGGDTRHLAIRAVRTGLTSSQSALRRPPSHPELLHRLPAISWHQKSPQHSRCAAGHCRRSDAGDQAAMPQVACWHVPLHSCLVSLHRSTLNACRLPGSQGRYCCRTPHQHKGRCDCHGCHSRQHGCRPACFQVL